MFGFMNDSASSLNLRFNKKKKRDADRNGNEYKQSLQDAL
jgi:hypothetical protein